MLKLAGYNYFSQLGEKSNKKSIDNYPAISPPINSRFNISSISSYSLYYDHAIIITKEGEVFAIGYNGGGQMYGSLHHDIIQKYTKFNFKDCVGRSWHPISAACGYEYTLYLVTSDRNQKTRLALSHYKYGPETELPLFLNIGNLNPVAIYGGRFNSAAIDDEGAIIYIPELIIKSPTVLIDSTPLPNDDKAISIACCNEFIAVVGLSGNLYLSQIPKTKEKIVFQNSDFFSVANETSQEGDGIVTLIFEQIETFKNTKIINVSGTFEHCFVITEDGKVFGIGSNENGKLGIGKETEKVNEFTEIKSLSKYKIKAAYAGWSHSLFQTENGKILACGSNTAGELLGPNTSRESIFIPVETTINEGANFCIAGKGLSCAFIGVDPIMSPNRPITIERLKEKARNNDVENENKRLKEENITLHNKIKNLSKQKGFKLDILDQETINKLKTIEVIGHGSQSEVIKVTQVQELALKVLHQDTKKKSASENHHKNMLMFKNLLQEYEIIQALQHHNIVKAFGFCFGDENHPPSILMQFYPYNLSDVIDELNEIKRVCAIFEICLGMEAVHAAHLIHRNLKPENILIDKNGHIVVSDFGISCLVDLDNQTQSRTVGVGTLKFMAPELLNESENYDNKVDVYSFGVIMFFVLTGGELPKISIIDVGNGKKAKIPESVNQVARELINKCWSTRADDRPSFSEIIDYIKQNNFKLVDNIEKDITQIKEFLSI